MDYLAIVLIAFLIFLVLCVRGYENRQREKDASWEPSKNERLFKRVLNVLVLLAIIWLIVNIFYFLGHPNNM